MYLGLVWAAASGQEGLDSLGSGLADFHRDYNQDSSARAESCLV